MTSTQSWFFVFFAAVVVCRAARSVREPTPSTLVTVLPSSPQFRVDVASWNGAPADSASPPSAVYFAHSKEDVVLAVSLALASNMSVVARSGRHAYTGLGGIGNFVVVDVSNLTDLEIYREPCTPSGSAGRALVGAGLRQYDAQVEALRLQLMFPSGTCPTVGVSGFTLGGGYGFFSRKFSVNSDNIISAEVVHVDADGHVAVSNVTAATDPDFMWALKGGGNNNFGVVTRLEITLHSAPANVSHIRLLFPNTSVCVDHVQPLYDAQAPNAPQELTIQLVFYSNGCDVVMVYLGNASAAEQAAQLESSWLTIPGVVAGPFLEVSAQGAINNFAGCGNRTTSECLQYVNGRDPNPDSASRFGALSVYVDEAMGSDGASSIFKSLQSKPKELGFGFAEVDPYGPTSAVNLNCSSADTAFPHRTALYHVQLLVYWSSASLDQIANSWLENVFALHMSSLGQGSYRNYPNMVLGPDALERFYRGNLPRLRKIKEDIDPLRVFRSVQGL